MAGTEPVCVLIATLATGERAPYLLRALDSLRAQAPVIARPIVIINGDGADPALVHELGRRPGITLLRLAESSLPRALAAGRRRVDTPFFAQLDDDDELFSDALAIRLRRITQADQPDAVITNGIIRNGVRETLSMTDVAAIERNPLKALMEQNWMLPGSALFRTDTIGEPLFEATPRFLEWTYMALLLASRYHIALLATPTMVHYEGLAFSVDRSRECALGRPLAFEAALKLDLPRPVQRSLRSKRGAAWHAAAEAARLGEDRRAAWTAHLRSLAAPGGWRYATYTRYLLGFAGRRRGAAAATGGIPP